MYEPSQTSKILVAIAALLFASVISIADAVTGILPDITIFYLIPVIAGTYVIGLRFGLFVAIVAAVTELFFSERTA